MKENTFEPYYKRGLGHFIFKKLLNLGRPTNEIRLFYLSLIGMILMVSLLIG